MDSLDCDVGGTYCSLCRMQKKSNWSETVYSEKWGGGKEYHHCTTYKCGTKFYADRVKSKKTTRVTVGKKCIQFSKEK